MGFFWSKNPIFVTDFFIRIKEVIASLIFCSLSVTRMSWVRYAAAWLDRQEVTFILFWSITKKTCYIWHI